MPDPITTLGLAKSASDIVKQALEFARESRNAALAEKLIDAYRDIVELDDTNRQLKRENVELQTTIAELKRRPEIAEKLRFDGMTNGYYKKLDDGKEEGPFCRVCWDVDGRLVRLADTSLGSRCLYCVPRKGK
jgi:hypothetical protein